MQSVSILSPGSPTALHFDCDTELVRFCEILNMSVEFFLSFNTKPVKVGAGFRTILKV